MFLGPDHGDIIRKKCFFKSVPTPPFILSGEGFFFPLFYYSQKKALISYTKLIVVFSTSGRPTSHISGEALTYSKSLKGEFNLAVL